MTVIFQNDFSIWFRNFHSSIFFRVLNFYPLFFLCTHKNAATFIHTSILCCCCCLCFEFSIWSSNGFHLFLSFVFLVLKRFVIRYYNLTSCMNKNNCNCFVSFHVKKMLCCSSSVGPYLWGFDACIFFIWLCCASSSSFCFWKHDGKICWCVHRMQWNVVRFVELTFCQT